MPDATPDAITELKVSAHLMMLDAGVFCVFNTPGAAASDSVSGLPGVRISHAPAAGHLAGTVSISGFGGDGWLGSAQDAALIRVSGGPAQVLVTVYQEMDSAHAAPKLQVIRLTEDAAAAQPEPTPPPAQEPEHPAPVEVAAHVYGLGDVGGHLGEWVGERGSKRWIEGFGLAPSNGIATGDIEYQAVLGRGWLSPWSEGGQFCGSRGMSLPILGLRVRLRGAAAEAFTASVEATFVDGAAIGPIEAGEACEAPSLAALEAFRIVFEPRAQTAKPAQGRAAKAEPVAPPSASQPPARKTPIRKAAVQPSVPAPEPAPKRNAAKAAKPIPQAAPPVAKRGKAPAVTATPTPPPEVKRAPTATRRR